MTFRLRPMYLQESNVVLDLIHKSTRELCSKDYTTEQLETVIESYNSAFLKQGKVILAEQQSQIIGIAKAEPYGYQMQLIVALFTHPNYTRQGIGRLLTQEIERRASIRNIKKMVVTASLTAVDFYLSVGYEYQRKTTIFIDIPCVLLKKQLNLSYS